MLRMLHSCERDVRFPGWFGEPPSTTTIDGFAVLFEIVFTVFEGLLEADGPGSFPA